MEVLLDKALVIFVRYQDASKSQYIRMCNTSHFFADFAGICLNTCLLVYTLDEIYGLAIIVTGLENCKIGSRPVMVMAMFTISYLTRRAVLDYLGTSIKIRH